MTPHQQGIIELVGVFKERFGLLITHEQAAAVVLEVAQPMFAAGRTIERWNVYEGFSGPTDREVKNG